MGLGIPEILIALMMVALGLLPTVAALWALFTLRDIQKGQEQMQSTLEAIERLLQKP